MTIMIFFTIGNYEMHITTKTTSTNRATLCKGFSFSGIKRYQTAIECNRAMHGDTVIVQKTDGGILRLFEVYPIGMYSDLLFM